MNDPVVSYLDSLKPVFTVVNEILNAWTGEGCMQVPALLLAVATKLNWNAKQIRESDPLIRAYVKNPHSPWDITRGAHGGIVRRADQEKKRAVVIAKQQAKAEIQAMLSAKLAASSGSNV